MKQKQQDVSSEVIVTAIDVKCNFTSQMNANQWKILNTVTELLQGGLETRHFKGSQVFSTIRHFSVIIKIIISTFLPYAKKKSLIDLTIYFYT